MTETASPPRGRILTEDQAVALLLEMFAGAVVVTPNQQPSEEKTDD